jgi:predicted RecB family nuclease
MTQRDPYARISATDLLDFLACPRRVVLNRAARAGLIQAPPRGEQREFITGQGNVHESRVLSAFQEGGAEVARLDDAWGGDAVRRTQAAMERGAEVIYQAELTAAPWMGRPDFLVRVDGPSRIGPYHYEPLDAKLSKVARADAVTQLTFYALLLESAQGVRPERVGIMLGTGATEYFATRQFADYVEAARERFLEWARTAPPDADAIHPDPVLACRHCDWVDTCDAVRRRDDHLVFLAGATPWEAARLQDAGVTTLAGAADMDPDQAVPGIHPAALRRLTAQARLQVQGRRSGQRHFLLLQDADRGFQMLPPPSAFDVYISLLTDPLAADGPLIYLYTFVEAGQDGTSEARFRFLHTRSEEARGFDDLVDHLMQRWRQHREPMHIYHYGRHVVDRLANLMGRLGQREEEMSELLASGAFVDLARVVRRTVQFSTESYALSVLAPFFGAEVAGPPGLRDASDALLLYHRWQDEQADGLLGTLREYATAECLQLKSLHGWLEKRRGRGTAAYSPTLGYQSQRPPQLVVHAAEDPAHTLVDQLVRYHWREERHESAQLAARRSATEEELFSDPDAIAQLTWTGSGVDPDLGAVDQYRFDREQPFKLAPGSWAMDPETGSRYDILRLDPLEGVLELPQRPYHRPRHLIPSGPPDTNAIVAALIEVRQALLGAPPRAPVAEQLLRRLPPRFTSTALDDPSLPNDMVARAQRLAVSLDRSYLAVQGPPGSGKTHLAAAVIVEFLKSGRRVGVLGPSHKVVTNLLAAVLARAPRGLVHGVQKAPEKDAVEAASIQVVPASNKPVERRLEDGSANLFGGTAWLFARPAFRGRLDCLVIDEAAQMPLSTALAASTASANLILVGDPQQLQQPVTAAHPQDTDRSVLGHLMVGASTMPAHLGLFLASTRRMHPRVARFISESSYDGRLTALPELDRQTVEVAGHAAAGLWYVPVEHAHRSTESVEEARAVSAIVEKLLDGWWTDASETRRRLTLDDVLLVAPFNAQVHLLEAMLPASRVGTVDKFQGQEAPVVIYSMAASDGTHVTRGEQFLFNPNRLNVALSRARALAVLVMSPRIVAARPSDPDALRVVSAICRFIATADPLPPDVQAHVAAVLAGNGP